MATRREIHKACDDLLESREAVRKQARDEIIQRYQDLQDRISHLEEILEGAKTVIMTGQCNTCEKDRSYFSAAFSELCRANR